MPTRAVVLPPLYEAHLITYITMYDLCDKHVCWDILGRAIREYGRSRRGIVYRGQSKANRTIQPGRTPFFSTTPQRAMAELFVEKDWDRNLRVGHLFKIHLKSVPTLSTREVTYTFSADVQRYLREMHAGKQIQKGSGDYTIDDYMPLIPHALQSLVFEDGDANSEEVLVLNAGRFFKDKDCTQKGFAAMGHGDYETWYASGSK